MFLCVFLACTSSKSPSTSTKTAQFIKGQLPFQFETQKITTFEIAKADPKTGDAWTARFERNREGIWEIAAGPGGPNLLDRKAHSSFIDHLLDTLKTLQVTRPALQGPPESFDLSPPRFALRWGQNELFLGSGKFASIGGTVYELEGAALKLLEYIPQFQSLREQTWLSPLTSDDIDEVELSRAGKKYFYAQREGSVWTDQQHKPVKPDMNHFLDQITHARIQEFIDDPEVSQRLAQDLRKNPMQELTLKDRNGTATQAFFKWEASGGFKKLYCLSTSRPTSVFRIFDESTRFFEPLRNYH